ncbi:MAG: Cna B-type domain-containing protein, partial [Solobacterium sp.]|nr:Cna B-type domain-containing protein [Solobacterium sp.]
LTEAGSVEFGEIEYTAEGTYVYKISETSHWGPGWSVSPTTAITATVKVTDKGDGTLETSVTYDPADKKFTNIYTKDDSGIVYIFKADRDPSDSKAVGEEDVWFKLYNVNTDDKKSSDINDDNVLVFKYVGTVKQDGDTARKDDDIKVYEFVGLGSDKNNITGYKPNTPATSETPGDIAVTGKSGKLMFIGLPEEMITNTETGGNLTAIEVKNAPGYESNEVNPATPVKVLKASDEPLLTPGKNTEGGAGTANFVDAPLKGNISVTKVYSDGNGNHANDPVTITLYQRIDGKDTVYSTVTIGKAENWTYSWSNLPFRDDEGNLCSYYVNETPVTAGYYVSYSSNNLVTTDNGAEKTTDITVTNTKKEDKKEEKTEEKKEEKKENRVYTVPKTSDEFRPYGWALSLIGSITAAFVSLYISHKHR